VNTSAAFTPLKTYTATVGGWLIQVDLQTYVLRQLLFNSKWNILKLFHVIIWEETHIASSHLSGRSAPWC